MSACPENLAATFEAWRKARREHAAVRADYHAAKHAYEQLGCALHDATHAERDALDAFLRAAERRADTDTHDPDETMTKEVL